MKLVILVMLIGMFLIPTAFADVEIGTGDVYFTDSNIILTDGQVFTNITARTSDVLIYDGIYLINFSATADTQIISLNYQTEGTNQWMYDATATTGILSATVETDTGRMYEFLVDSVLEDTGLGNGHITFTYSDWSTHSFIIRASSAAAGIHAWLNTVTNNMFLKPTVSEEESVTFEVTQVSGDGTITFHWFRDGVDQAHNSAIYTTSWPRWGDAAEVTCYISDDTTDSSNLTWTPVVVRARATSTVIPVDTTRSDEFINATDEMDIEKMLAAEMYIFTDAMGPLFLLIIIGCPMVMIYIRTGSMAIPGVIGVVSGSFLIGLLPTAYQGPVVVLIGVSIAGILISLYKGRSA